MTWDEKDKAALENIFSAPKASIPEVPVVPNVASPKVPSKAREERLIWEARLVELRNQDHSLTKIAQIMGVRLARVTNAVRSLKQRGVLPNEVKENYFRGTKDSTLQFDNRVLGLCQSGLSVHEIEVKLVTTKMQVYHARKRLIKKGLIEAIGSAPLGPKPKTIDRGNAILEMRAAGLGTKEIAEKLGLSESFIRVSARWARALK